jgi:hypothetical protein
MITQSEPHSEMTQLFQARQKQEFQKAIHQQEPQDAAHRWHPKPEQKTCSDAFKILQADNIIKERTSSEIMGSI